MKIVVQTLHHFMKKINYFTLQKASICVQNDFVKRCEKYFSLFHAFRGGDIQYLPLNINSILPSEI